MKSKEDFVSNSSNYYVYSPSQIGQNMFFYVLYAGYFVYEKGYYLHRDSYDSFLLMYIEKGSLTLEFDDRTRQVEAGSFVLIDCYQPHSYYSDLGWESVWCHFDGPTARAHYETIVSHLGNVFSLVNPYPIISKLESIYHTFLDGSVIREPLMSKFINDILTAFLLYTPQEKNASNYLNMAQEIISYINEHFTEDIAVDTLAEKAGLSVYHFIRTFKKETGFTPHEYIINTRLNTAKYLLQNSKLSVKDICFNTGFSCESVFCSAFKKHLNVTPTQYRNMIE